MAAGSESLASFCNSSMAFRGSKARNAAVTPGRSPELSTIAKRCPSVATITMPPLRSTSKAPFSVKRDSSLEIANTVFAIMAPSTPIGISASCSGISGNSGKLSRDMPAIRVFERPQTRFAQ